MNRIRNWILAILLSSPIILFDICHLFNHDPELVATGFIQYDNVTYVGNAIQYTWPEHNGIFYSNRLNDSHSHKQIYFNPQLFILAAQIKIGITPAFALMLFNLVSAILFFRVAISIYDHVKPVNEFRILNIVLFSWGGGLLCASGFLVHLFANRGTDLWSSLFVLDPAHGWWALNAGRSLFFSMEAWYHTLFFAIILAVLKNKWIVAVLLSLLLSLSHPFTGIELLLIITCWVVVEMALKRNSIPWYFAMAMVLILAFHIWYYLFYLNKFPEHFSVYQQYSLNWKYRFYHFIPAYALTLVLVMLAIRVESVKSYFSKASNRLFICWAMIAFLLSNHEIFINPMQPLHFTRGYIWSALFFAGLPGLQFLWRRLAVRKTGVLFCVLLSLIFLSDNLLWITKNTRRVNEQTSVTQITREQKTVLKLLSDSARYNDLIVGKDEVVPYLASITTKSNIWISHPYNTPFYQAKKSIYQSFINNGELPPEWKTLRIFFVVTNHESKEQALLRTQSDLIFESPHYSIFRKEPQ